MSATVYYEPNKLPAGILALLVHGLFFSLLYFGFSWNRQAYLPATMSVELWSSLPDKAVSPPRKEEEVAPQPPQPEKIAAPDIAIPDKNKVDVKEKKAVSKAAERARLKKEAAREKAQIARQNAEREKAERLRMKEQAALQQAEQARQAEQAAAIGRVVDEYRAKIQAKIRRNIVMPPDVANDARAEFLVTLLPGGAVLPPRLIKSSGNTAYDDAVERAILKSDPLPLPPDAELFNRFRELDLVFKPTE